MTLTLRARVHKGTLEPVEDVDLPEEGKEVTVTVVEETRDRARFRRAAGSWKGTLDVKAFLRNVSADRRLPSRRPIPSL